MKVYFLLVIWHAIVGFRPDTGSYSNSVIIFIPHTVVGSECSEPAVFAEPESIDSTPGYPKVTEIQTNTRCCINV